MLHDLNQLAIAAKQKSDNYNKAEFSFSVEFKEKFKELNPNFTIEFYNNTSKIISSSNLLILVPNQWFVIASFFNEYILAIKQYKSVVNSLNISKEEITKFRDNKIISSDLESKIKNQYKLNDSIRIIKFLTDYSWWFGSKTIDRADYFVSPILNLAGVVNVTQSYIADLADLLSLNNELIDILVKDYSNFFNGLYLPHSSINLNSNITAKNIIYYGSPGTGKSFTVNNIIKNIDSKYFERITFHPEYDNSNFIGSYKPITEKNHADYDEVKYKFVPQTFTNIYESAWKDLQNPYYLIIEEINRGNCAEIFGEIFQLLDRNSNYTVSPSLELKTYLINQLGEDHYGIKNGLKLPPNLNIMATMNTSDQSLFPMDSAFKRRWDWEYIPICYDKTYSLENKQYTNESYEFYVKLNEEISFKWIDFIKTVNQKIKSNPNLGMDKCIGNYFIKPQFNEISLKEFVNKAIFYLWNDVFKDEDEIDSIFKKDIFYEDFFPIDTKGASLVKDILETLSIEIIPIAQ